MNTNTNWTATTGHATQSGRAFGMRASGGYALHTCAFAGVPTLERGVDVAIKRNPGTHVWSPPRR
ncbi:MAG: hypothetical protein QOH37_422 [Nocardioidaceae bacterium]|jgi:hypothetical protein|nr:hypothetical protein [Nocardioidaceae bacterium]